MGHKDQFRARNWNAVRIALLHESVSPHRAEDNMLLTKGANADNTSYTLCPDGFALIDDPLQLGAPNGCVLEYNRHLRKMQRNEGAVE